MRKCVGLGTLAGNAFVSGGVVAAYLESHALKWAEMNMAIPLVNYCLYKNPYLSSNSKHTLEGFAGVNSPFFLELASDIFTRCREYNHTARWWLINMGRGFCLVGFWFAIHRNIEIHGKVYIVSTYSMWLFALGYHPSLTLDIKNLLLIPAWVSVGMCWHLEWSEWRCYCRSQGLVRTQHL